MKIQYISPFPLKQAKPGDAGYDIASAETKTINPKSSEQFDTGLYMAIPSGYVGKVVSRSGLSFKHGLEVGAGVIDSGYRGQIRIHLHNFGEVPVTIERGDRIAQIIILKHEAPEFILVNSLEETERGSNGFGHTGIKTMAVVPESFCDCQKNGLVVHPLFSLYQKDFVVCQRCQKRILV